MTHPYSTHQPSPPTPLLAPCPVCPCHVGGRSPGQRGRVEHALSAPALPATQSIPGGRGCPGPCCHRGAVVQARRCLCRLRPGPNSPLRMTSQHDLSEIRRLPIPGRHTWLAAVPRASTVLPPSDDPNDKRGGGDEVSERGKKKGKKKGWGRGDESCTYEPCTRRQPTPTQHPLRVTMTCACPTPPMHDPSRL